MPGNTATSAANTKVPAHVGWTRCSPLCSQAGKKRSSVFSCLGPTSCKRLCHHATAAGQWGSRLPLSSPGNLRPFTESQNCRWLTPTTGGVMGVIAGKCHCEGPPEAEASSRSLGSAVSHGSVSVSDPSEVSGTRCIPSSPMVAGLLQTKGVQATDYSVWSGYPQQQTTASGLIQ